MLTTFILGFAIVVLAILGMAVGVLCGRRPLKEGGCGDFGETGACSICGGDRDDGQARARNGGTPS